MIWMQDKTNTLYIILIDGGQIYCMTFDKWSLDMKIKLD